MKRLILLASVIFASVAPSNAQSPAISKAVTDYIANAYVSGTAALVSGTAVVPAPLVTGSSKIIFSPLAATITAPIFTSAIVSGTSFTAVSGTTGTASGAFNYLIINR